MDRQAEEILSASANGEGGTGWAGEAADGCMKFEYIARFTITFALIAAAFLSDADRLRYFFAVLAVLVLGTIWCLVIIEKNGLTEQALKFRNMYLDSAP